MICGLGKTSSGKPCIILKSNLWMQKDRINQTNSLVKHHLLSSHGQREEVPRVALETVRLPKGQTLSHGYQSFPLKSHQTHQCWSGPCQQQPWPGRHLHLQWVMARRKLLSFVLGGGSAVVHFANREHKPELWKKLLVSTPHQTFSYPGIFPYNIGGEDVVLAASSVTDF